MLKEQTRHKLTQEELHELVHWHVNILSQLHTLPADFITDQSGGSTTLVKTSQTQAQAAHSAMVSKLFEYGATSNPYSAAVSAADLPSVVVLLCPPTIMEWQIPEEVKHNHGRFELGKGCTRCGMPQQNQALDFCGKCVTMLLAASPHSRLSVHMDRWEPCLVCRMLAAPLDAGVMVNEDWRKVRPHDRHGHAHCLAKVQDGRAAAPAPCDGARILISVTEGGITVLGSDATLCRNGQISLMPEVEAKLCAGMCSGGCQTFGSWWPGTGQ